MISYVLSILKFIFWLPVSNKDKVELYQERIRQLEWNAIKPYITKQATFLDVGCGAGFSLMKAYSELECEIQGIDPEPGAHGVGRFTDGLWKERPIIQGTAESLPFPDASFDIVYSSHVLEHVNSEKQALQEMKRVLKPGGVLIIGMPTSSMAWVALLSAWFFTTHITIYHCLRSIGKSDFKNRLLRIFIPTSHSFPRANIITYDLLHYRKSYWRSILGKHFNIKQQITPGLYPYPDYIQWFPLIKKGGLSSSVFFICGKD